MLQILCYLEASLGEQKQVALSRSSLEGERENCFNLIGLNFIAHLPMNLHHSSFYSEDIIIGF